MDARCVYETQQSAHNWALHEKIRVMCVDGNVLTGELPKLMVVTMNMIRVPFGRLHGG